MKLSTIIITLNEESNISRAITSVSFADEVIVVDSHSQDNTVALAKQLGAKVVEQEFLGYGQQKNFALDHCQGEWVLWLDADEEVSEELQKSILDVINRPDAQDLYFINRRTQFMNQWIYHGGWYPDKIARLFRKDKARFSTPHVHEKLQLISGEAVGRNQVCLSGELNHYSFPTFESQVLTNIKFARLGAQELLKHEGTPSLMKVIIRPWGKFIECYLLKRGFLDGKAGLIIALNAAYSLFMKYAMAYTQRRPF